MYQVGCMMIRQVTQINWRYVGDVLPSFVVMTFIPFSYSVAYGLIAYDPLTIILLLLEI
jgi:AGZA family xanthine/uracil permease-like MFS transporter